MNTEDYQKAIYGWLNAQGYPLEMKVATFFGRHGLGIRQGWYFTDQEEGKPREIDVLAFVNIEKGHPITIQLVIECKRSNKPFVVFSYPDRTLQGSPLQFPQANPTGHQALQKFVADGIINRLTIFSPMSPLGYSMTQANISTPNTTPNVSSASSNKMRHLMP